MDHPHRADRQLCRSVFVSLSPTLPLANWFRLDGENLILSVYAQPGAKHTEIQGLHGDALKIRVAAPPLEGRANDEIRRFLARLLALPLRDVALVSGEKSRRKRLAIRGGNEEWLKKLLDKL